jgi:Protein of unknown function (DUF1091)
LVFLKQADFAIDRIWVDSPNRNLINGSLSAIKNEKQQYYVNMNFELFKDIERIYVSLIACDVIRWPHFIQFKGLFSLSSSQGRNFECRDKLFETRVDCCKVAAIMGNPFGKIFFKNLYEAADFPLECPYFKGQHKVTNFTLGIPEVMFFKGNIQICFSFTFYAKLKGVKKFTNLIILKSHLSYEA